MTRWSIRRRGVTAAILSLALVAGAAGWLASPWGPRGSAADPAGPVVFATGPADGLAHRYGLALATSSGGELATIHAVVTAGSWENLDRLRWGEATFALATADVVEAYLATQPSSIRAVARLYDSYVHLVVREGSDIHRLADLRGRRVAVGPAGSGMALVADRMLTAAGMDPRTDVTISELDPRTAVAAVSADQVDAFLFVDAVPSPDLASLSGARFIDLADVATTLPGSPACPAPACAVYHAGTVPAGAYSALPVAITTVAVPTLLLTTAQVSDEVVGHLLKRVFDSVPQIAPTIPAVREVDRHAAIFTGAVPLHEGAKAYYRATKIAAFAPLGRAT